MSGRAYHSALLALAGVLLVLLAACADSATGPVTELRIDEIRPRPFRAGERVTVRGPGVGRAKLFLDGAELEVVKRSGSEVVVRAPADLPRCADPLPVVTLRAEAAELWDTAHAATLGRPALVDLPVARHTVERAVRHGCPLEFRQAGTYGIALYRVADPAGTSRSERRSRASFTVTLDGGAAAGPGAAAASGSAGIAGPGLIRAPDLWLGSAAVPLDTVCTKAPATVGDAVPLTSPWGTSDGEYRVVSASEHFAVLVERDSLAAYSAARRMLVEVLARTLEEQVYPLLARVFEEWPDTDGDGRLNVLLVAGRGASYGGGHGYNPDGCIGDFVSMAHGLLDAGLEADLNNPLEIIAHEATHWYDIGPDLPRKVYFPDWSVEAFPSLVERLWRWEREGRGFWENRGLECPPGTTCRLVLMSEHRYGWPGLSHDGGYGHGQNILSYLLQQAVPFGAPPHSALGGLRHRRVPHGGLALQPVFQSLNGPERSEEELQGEYLLSLYADDHVPGVSERLQQFSWNVPATSPDYPLRSFVLDGARTTSTVGLATPDGIVFEVAARAGAVLTVEPAAEDLAVAVVRAR